MRLRSLIGTALVSCVCLTASSALGAPRQRTQPARPAARPALKYVFTNQRLQAVNRRTGKVRWTFGHGLGPLTVWDSKTIYTFSADGKMFGINRWTGRLLWSATLKLDLKSGDYLIHGLELSRGTLFVSHSHGVIAYYCPTGQEQWRITEGHGEYHWINPGASFLADSAVLICYSASGAYTHDVTKAFDRRTGRLLWERNAMVTQVKGDRVSLHSLYPSDPPREWSGVVDARTGKVLTETGGSQGG